MYTISDILLLLAAAQGFFLSLLLLQKHGKLAANRLLATLMLLLSIFLLHLYLGELGLTVTNPLWIDMTIGLAFLIGPLHWYYVKALVQHWSMMPAKILLHALPLIIYQMLILVYHVSVNHKMSLYYTRLEPLQPTGYYYLYHWAVIASAVIYFTAALKIIQRHARRIKDMFSTTEHIKLMWLRNLNAIILIVIAEYALENILFLFDINLSNYFDLTTK